MADLLILPIPLEQELWLSADLGIQNRLTGKLKSDFCGRESVLLALKLFAAL